MMRQYSGEKKFLVKMIFKIRENSSYYECRDSKASIVFSSKNQRKYHKKSVCTVYYLVSNGVIPKPVRKICQAWNFVFLQKKIRATVIFSEINRIYTKSFLTSKNLFSVSFEIFGPGFNVIFIYIYNFFKNDDFLFTLVSKLK